MADSTGVELASDRIGIVLDDDQALIRRGLRRVLDLDTDLAMVGVARDVKGGTYLDPTVGARLAGWGPALAGTHAGLLHGQPNRPWARISPGIE